MERSDWERLPSHEVLPVERIGDLLIVRPKGDPLGFQSSQFQAEYARVTRLASDDAVKNVLVDLSASKYFGSEMIGALVRLRNAVAESAAGAPPAGPGKTDSDLLEVREATTAGGAAGGDLNRGGVMALSGVSEDMQTGLSVMNVDNLWLTFEDEDAAVRKMAHIPPRDRVRRGLRKSRWFFLVVLVAGVACLLLLPATREWFFRPTAADDYKSLVSMEQRWRRKLNTKLTPGDLARAGETLAAELKPIQRRNDDEDITRAHRRVLVAAARLMDWMKNPTDPSAEDAFEAEFAVATDAMAREARGEPIRPKKVGPPPHDDPGTAAQEPGESADAAD